MTPVPVARRADGLDGQAVRWSGGLELGKEPFV